MFSALNCLKFLGETMLHRVIGPSGSGKTEYILSRLGEALKKGKTCFVIVPEQQSVDYEAMLCDRFGDSVNLLCEVLNFERLPNRIARDFGGLAVNNIDKGGACALLSLVAESLGDKLSEYSAVASDSDFAQSLFSLISKMKMSLISPDMIKTSIGDAALADEPRLKAKLRDIALIYSEYEKNFGSELFDPRDALTRLGNELPSKPFFKDSCVFIDSYYTFTQQEYAIIKEIIAQSDSTYISFTTDYSRDFFKENERSCQRIGALAHGKFEDYITSTQKRTNSETLAFISENIWRNNAGEIPDDGSSVRMIAAKNRFDEAEAAAAQILEFVREGNRFRDITVLTGNTDTYSPIIDSVFSRAGIPCYMSAKEELSSKPLFSFIIASLSVVIEDFSLRSIKRYIKSGYTDLTAYESDALLNYASAWKLSGRAWYSESDWTLNPDGYREGDISARGAKQLETANVARRKVVEPLAALRDSLKEKKLTISKALRALYTHIISMNADEKLRINAERYLNNGNREESEREIQLWKLLINIINQLDSLCGDREVTPKRFLSLIKLMCDCYSLGAIPASADSVTFGSASLIRAGGSKMVVVLGVCDGEFPSAVSMGGFFDRTEASVLEQADLLLADTMEKQLNTSRFFVYSALSAPTDRLVLLCPRAELAGGELRPSSAWFSVEKMLKDIKIKEFSDKDLLYSPEAIAAYFPSLEDGELKSDIETALRSNNISVTCDFPQLTVRESRINSKEEILKLSPSKFETYIKCPFSYFGQYVLGLQRKKINEFSVSEIGNFAHKILDMFMRECVSTGRFICPSEHQRKALLSRLADEYLDSYIGAEAAADKQFMHIYSNMIKTVDIIAENLCEEFSASKFIPTGFEFKIGLGKESDLPPIEYDVAGKRVLLRGSIDRVDTYEANGVRYVRVIDYKTYDKAFSADLVEYGMDTQLLHYLFAYCGKTDSKPAGALYYKAVLPYTAVNGSETPEDIKAELKKALKRSGILLDDPEIAYAMSPDLSFVPVTYSQKEGKLTTRSKSKVLYTPEEFDSLSDSLKNQVKDLASNVFCGNMDIAPNDCDNKVDPCKYCPLGDLCRNKKNKEEDDESDESPA